MSTLTKVLERNIKVIEKNADLTEEGFRLGTSSDAAGRMAQ